MPNELKPCPFCGCSEINISRIDGNIYDNPELLEVKA